MVARVTHREKDEFPPNGTRGKRRLQHARALWVAASDWAWACRTSVCRRQRRRALGAKYGRRGAGVAQWRRQHRLRRPAPRRRNGCCKNRTTPMLSKGPKPGLTVRRCCGAAPRAGPECRRAPPSAPPPARRAPSRARACSTLSCWSHATPVRKGAEADRRQTDGEQRRP